MPLHSQARSFLQSLIDAGVPQLHTMSPDEARALRREQRLRWNLQPDPETSTEDLRIPGTGQDIPIRIYRPAAEPHHPALVYYHGGGWVLGGLDTYDHVCSLLARETGFAVISVDYRLAPEYPFPAGLEDVDASLQWILHHPDELRLDSAKIAAAGDSAGGNLLTVACHLACERGDLLPRCQVLIYPVTAPVTETAANDDLAEGYFLTRDSMHWFFDHYASGQADPHDPRVFPMLIDDLRGMPPAFIATAEYDPLRDEGEAYAERLRGAGVSVTCKRYTGMIHVFLNLLPPMDTRRELIADIATYVHAALG